MPAPNILTVGGLISQVRTLLQDTDLSTGLYRYSTDSIVTNLNQAMADLFRLRPDLFMDAGFAIPSFDPALPDVAVGIDQQYMPALIYYVVGLTQARDDEQNQDARALGFLKIFQQTVINGVIV